MIVPAAVNMPSLHTRATDWHERSDAYRTTVIVLAVVSGVLFIGLIIAVISQNRASKKREQARVNNNGTTTATT